MALCLFTPSNSRIRRAVSLGSLKCHVMSGAVVSVFSPPLNTFGSSAFLPLPLCSLWEYFLMSAFFVCTWEGRLVRSRSVRCLQTMICEEMHCYPRAHQNTISTCKICMWHIWQIEATGGYLSILSFTVFSFSFEHSSKSKLFNPFSVPTCSYIEGWSLSLFQMS